MIPSKVDRVVVLVIVADVSLEDWHCICKGFSKLLDPIIRFLRGTVKSKVCLILFSVAATLQANYGYIVIEA